MSNPDLNNDTNNDNNNEFTNTRLQTVLSIFIIFCVIGLLVVVSIALFHEHKDHSQKLKKLKQTHS